MVGRRDKFAGKMIDFYSIYLYCEQPSTCPTCGVRTEIIIEWSHTNCEADIHRCLNPDCLREFLMGEDEDFWNDSLL